MEPGTPPDVSPRKPRSAGAVAAGAGLQLAVSIIVFVYVGQWLDRRLGTAPVFLLGCMFVGAGASFYSLYRQVTSAQRREDAYAAAERARRAGDGPAR